MISYFTQAFIGTLAENYLAEELQKLEKEILIMAAEAYEQAQDEDEKEYWTQFISLNKNLGLKDMRLPKELYRWEYINLRKTIRQEVTYHPTQAEILQMYHKQEIIAIAQSFARIIEDKLYEKEEY